MKLDSLDSYTDDELRQAIAYADDLLKQRDQTRKEKALEDAKAILAKAGLNLQDIAGNGKGKPAKTLVYRAGLTYQHPMQPELTWNAKGQKPNWLRALEKQHLRAVPAGGNDNGERITSAPPSNAARPRG